MMKNAAKKALIFDVVRNSFVDGPGIRTTVFFKGCNLRCRWCHNPESRNAQKEIMFYKNKCTACGACKTAAVDEDFFCPNDAKELCGREYTVDDIMEIVLKDRIFYETSGGGVTFSGGECMLQVDFLTRIMGKCKECGIHTAVDTAGDVPWESFERILSAADMFLYDLKLMDRERHREYTGRDNGRILENLARLLGCARVWVRIPVVPGVNDSREEIRAMKDFFDKAGYPEKIELLPYPAMGEHKYAALGMRCEKFSAPTEEQLDEIKSILAVK